ncbi:MAG: GDCCVxC domain-containing (seleno)protein [Nitrosomonas sp.]
MKTFIEHSIITCPYCNHKEVECKSNDECKYFYDCVCCGSVIEPKPGDCCVFYSYGSIKCKQE